MWKMDWKVVWDGENGRAVMVASIGTDQGGGSTEGKKPMNLRYIL